MSGSERHLGEWGTESTVGVSLRTDTALLNGASLCESLAGLNGPDVRGEGFYFKGGGGEPKTNPWRRGAS